MYILICEFLIYITSITRREDVGDRDEFLLWEVEVGVFCRHLADLGVTAGGAGRFDRRPFLSGSNVFRSSSELDEVSLFMSESAGCLLAYIKAEISILMEWK